MTPTPSQCSQCGHPLNDGARFCGGCGAPLAPAVPVPLTPIASPQAGPSAAGGGSPRVGMRTMLQGAGAPLPGSAAPAPPGGTPGARPGMKATMIGIAALPDSIVGALGNAP